MAIRAKFTGAVDDQGMPREYLEGIPAADLSDEDYEALSTEQKAAVRRSDLYDVKSAERPSSAAGTQSKAGGGD